MAKKTNTKKTTKKLTIKTKKFKKKQKCYAKVQAYKTVNGVKHFGKWSKVNAMHRAKNEALEDLISKIPVYLSDLLTNDSVQRIRNGLN